MRSSWCDVQKEIICTRFPLGDNEGLEKSLLKFAKWRGGGCEE